jgi:hypothetical protein
MEKSFVAYTARYPQAAPLPDMDGAQFNVELISPRVRQGPSPKFDGLERHGDFAEAMVGGFASVLGAGSDSIREHGGGGAAAGFELARSDSEGRFVTHTSFTAF